MISWTPYGIVSLIKAFTSIHLQPVTTLIPSMFAKTSLVWPALLFLVSNKRIRSKMRTNLNVNYKYYYQKFGSLNFDHLS